MYKELPGIFNNLRVFPEQFLSQSHIAFQPGIYLINFPVKDEGINNAEQQFYHYP